MVINRRRRFKPALKDGQIRLMTVCCQVLKYLVRSSPAVSLGAAMKWFSALPSSDNLSISSLDIPGNKLFERSAYPHLQ